jgi:hypothetical protein
VSERLGVRVDTLSASVVFSSQPVHEYFAAGAESFPRWTNLLCGIRYLCPNNPQLLVAQHDLK